MKHAILATWRTSPLRFCSAAVEPRATRETQQAYWALTERLALALPGGKAGASAILASASAGPGNRYGIDPMLVARDVQISTSADGRLAALLSHPNPCCRWCRRHLCKMRQASALHAAGMRPQRGDRDNSPSITLSIQSA